ncbi:hypothetical protein BJ138DRAFT_1115738 [Hygrophoropsis aurantiaca]|uniref:Uncharacterized protein n=1 Tax=Hygrophoropsis aurantiaca TaxID=72124 RepID=A0ACB8A4Y4_9AGAM|nr:hypothetical protein BJ138DRAFT_1115738 [Hygrophoropsis aurantiaca]
MDHVTDTEVDASLLDFIAKLCSFLKLPCCGLIEGVELLNGRGIEILGRGTVSRMSLSAHAYDSRLRCVLGDEVKEGKGTIKVIHRIVLHRERDEACQRASATRFGRNVPMFLYNNKNAEAVHLTAEQPTDLLFQSKVRLSTWWWWGRKKVVQLGDDSGALVDNVLDVLGTLVVVASPTWSSAFVHRSPKREERKGLRTGD